MSRSITATQLRVELRDLLSTIEDGPIEITKHGKVVAVLSCSFRGSQRRNPLHPAMMRLPNCLILPALCGRD
jgi:prevent-host-death family protein